MEVLGLDVNIMKLYATIDGNPRHTSEGCERQTGVNDLRAVMTYAGW